MTERRHSDPFAQAEDEGWLVDDAALVDEDASIVEATARIVDAGGDDDERRVEAALRPRRLS